MKALLLSALILVTHFFAQVAMGQICKGSLNELVDYESLSANHLDALKVQFGDPTLGPDNAEAVIVEFIDYACPFCRNMAHDIIQLSETHPNLQIIFKEFPIKSEHASALAARASLAAYRQSNWKSFHLALMQSPPNMSIEEAIVYSANMANIDLDQLGIDIHSSEIEAIIARNCKLANDIGISATPTTFIWGIVYEGQIEDSMLNLLATLAVDTNNFAAKKELYDEMIKEYPPEEYNYPDYFMKILKKIKDTTQQEIETMISEFDSHKNKLTKKNRKITKGIEELTNWWVNTKIFLGWGEAEQSALTQLRMEHKVIQEELRMIESNHEETVGWWFDLSYIIKQKNGNS